MPEMPPPHAPQKQAPIPKLFQIRLPERFLSLAQRFQGGPHHGGPHHGPGGHFHNPLERASSPWHSFCRIVSMAREKLGWILLVFLLVIAGSGLGLLSPLLMKWAVDSLNLLEKDHTADMQGLLNAIGVMAISYACSAVLRFFQGWLSEKLAQDTLYEFRKKLFVHLQLLPVKFFDLRTHGEILSRATNDVGMVAQLMSRGAVSFLANVLTLLCALVAMLWLSPLLTVVSLVTFPLSLIFTRVVGGKIRACFKSHQVVMGLLNSHIEEIMTAQKVVKAFNHEAQALEDFRAVNNEMKRLGSWAHIMGGSMGPIMALIDALGFAVLIGTGGWLAAKGAITIGVIAAFIQYSRQFSRPLTDIANQYNDIQSALAGAERVFAVMDEIPQPDSGTRQLPEPVRGELRFEHVNFAYNDKEPVLKDFSLEVAPGEKIALVGTTGAGKTTIVSLLMRFYEPNTGSISIDGIPLPEIPREALMRSMSMVLQDTWLFSGTIRDNIRYGRLESTDAEVEAAAASIGADQFIQRLPKGYDTEVTDNGGNLSQGQRQLLAIARAVLANAPILILDEATSNVDTRTELLVQRAMLRLMHGRTCIVIAHRLSTIRDADAILVLENGRIVEQGNRDTLLKAKGPYWKLEQSQYQNAPENHPEPPPRPEPPDFPPPPPHP